MADEENENPGFSIESGVPRQESTYVLNGEVVVPEFNNYDTNKSIANGRPIGCDYAGPSGHASAVVKANLADGTTKHLCARHWNSIYNNPEKVESFEWIKKGSDIASSLRSEKAKSTQRARGAAAAEEFITTGIHNPVRSPGRPPGLTDAGDQAAEEAAPLEAALTIAATSGGHTKPGHAEKLAIAHQALQHANSGGSFDPVAYHTKAYELGMTNHAEREEYHGYAKALQAEMIKRARNPEQTKMQELSRDLAVNPASPQNTAQSEIENLMQSDIPSEIQSGKTPNSRSED